MCFSCLTLFGQTKKGALHLFHDDMKVAYPSVVYDFLERYLYTLTNSTDGYELRQQMSDDKVKITSGDIDNIKRIHPDTPFSILRHEDAAYDICWTDDLGTPLLGLQFPIKYELLLGSPKAEIEKTIQKQLEGCSTSFNDVQIPSSLEPMPNGLLRSAPMVNYYVEELNTSAFYQKDSNHTITPVFSSEQKWYAAANMFQGVVSAITEYSLYVEQNMY